ncbi:MAG TPA: hypothetical protein VF494_07810 [Candidatus Limnocylindrales bacterium]
MDPLDHVRAGLDGLACAVCEGPVPAGSIQLLAHRDALAFVQVDCPACRSSTLAFLLGGEADGNARPGFEAPVTSDDVLDMHLFLRDWRGGTSALLGGDSPGRR